MEYGATYYLDGPGGTLTFNDFASATHLRLTDAIRSTPTRWQLADRPMRPGGLVPPKLQGPASIALPGVIADFTSPASRAAMMQSLRRFARSLLNAPGLLRWTESDGIARQMVVTSADGDPHIAGGGDGAPKSFLLSLVAEDPTVYGQTLHQSVSSALTASGGSFGFPFSFPFGFGAGSGGGLATVTNGGDVESWPILRAYGAVTGPIVKDLGSGELVSLPGLAIPAGSYAEVDCWAGTLRMNGSPQVPLDAFLDVPASDFWSLPPGTTTVQMVGSNFDGGAHVTVIYRDAYA